MSSPRCPTSIPVRFHLIPPPGLDPRIPRFRTCRRPVKTRHDYGLQALQITDELFS